jgi:hypothetical protein
MMFAAVALYTLMATNLCELTASIVLSNVTNASVPPETGVRVDDKVFHFTPDNSNAYIVFAAIAVADCNVNSIIKFGEVVETAMFDAPVAVSVFVPDNETAAAAAAVVSPEAVGFNVIVKSVATGVAI